jgi:hypothetical protein
MKKGVRVKLARSAVRVMVVLGFVTLELGSSLLRLFEGDKVRLPRFC